MKKITTALLVSSYSALFVQKQLSEFNVVIYNNIPLLDVMKWWGKGTNLVHWSMELTKTI